MEVQFNQVFTYTRKLNSIETLESNLLPHLTYENALEQKTNHFKLSFDTFN